MIELDDAAYEAEQRRIKLVHDTYIVPLGFGDWTTRLYYHRSSLDMPAKIEPQRAAFGTHVGMCCDVAWEYRQIGVHVDCSVTAEHDDATVEKLMIHELMHGVVAEMCEDDPTHKHEERVVTWLSDIVLWVVDHGKALGREEVMAQDTAVAAETPHSVDSNGSSGM